MANSVLAKMAVQISANTAEFNKALQSTSNNLKSFTGGIEKIAATVGIAFGVQQVAAFGLEVSKLAGEAEAVGIAFNRLPDSEKLMVRLKNATHNTVSELELMKRAVMASNFDISLEALPRLLEFATLRAQQTGQSVDYLVDSIVTGIGRKSKLILDNLGISAAQLSHELNGVSTEAASVGDVADAVGRIAEKSLANMADFSVNAASKLQQLGAAWDNLKVQIGKAANETGVFANVVDALRLQMIEFTDDWDKFIESGNHPGWLATTQEVLAAFEKWQKLIGNTTPLGPALGFDQSWLKVAKESVLTIGVLEGKVKDLNEQYKNIDITKTNELIKNRELVKSYEDQIDALKRLGETLPKVNVPQFGSSLSRAKAPGLTEKQDIRNQGFLAGVGELVPPDISRFKEVAGEIKAIQLDLSNSTADFVADMAETIGASIAGTYDFGKGFLLSLARFAGSFGKQLVALGVAALATKRVFANPVAAIAAGIALTVAASVVAGSIKGFNSGNMGSAAGSGGSGMTSTGSQLARNAAQNQFSFETVIKGEDLYVILSTYSRNRNRTSALLNG